MAQTDVCPENLRFTQDSIKNTFKEPYEHQRIDDAVDQIGKKQLNPGVLMPLRVVDHRSVLWSLDNRRLWVLRKAGVPTVNVNFVPPTYSGRSKEFFSSLNDQVERRYSSANYFPRVRGGVRSVGINRGSSTDGALRPPMRMRLNNPTTFAGTAQANRTPPPLSPPQSPPLRPLRDFTVRNNIHPLVSPLPNAYHHAPKTTVPKLSNKNPGPGEKKGSNSLWERVLNVVNWVMDPSYEKFVIVLALCFMLRQANNIWKGGVNGKLEIRETFAVREEWENIFR